MSYPKDILSTRAVVKTGLYAILPRGGLVNNVLPGVTGAKVSIVASPKLGASFVQYVIETEAGAAAQEPLCAETGVDSIVVFEIKIWTTCIYIKIKIIIKFWRIFH